MSEEIEIVDYLIDDIQTGKYEPDDRLPSENELADRFRVPRMVARKAMERLQEMGYVYSKQGVGSFVRDRRQRIPLYWFFPKSFSQKMADRGIRYESKNAFCEPIEFNNKIYETLGAAEDERVFKVGRQRIIDGQPLALHISYVAESRFPDIARTGRQITSMFEYYKERGYAQFQSKQTLVSVLYPTKYERELLACSSLIPLLVFEYDCVDERTGQTIDLTKALYRSDTFTYVV